MKKTIILAADILVDTSAWIDYFNKPDSKTGKTVEHILRDRRVVLAGIVLTEILQGAKIKREFDAILESLRASAFVERAKGAGG